MRHACATQPSCLAPQGAVTQSLGQRMGATVWGFDARSGMEVEQKPWRGDKELVYYDSISARRTCVGMLCHLPCCCPPIYKVTSERVLFTKWDMWPLCEDPIRTVTCGCCFAGRALLRECCCAVGASAAAAERRQKAQAKRVATAEEPSCVQTCCAIPIGRTIHYFDIDIVADIRAHQSCAQMGLNEGSLYLARMQGGDASNDGRDEAFFNIKRGVWRFSQLWVAAASASASASASADL